MSRMRSGRAVFALAVVAALLPAAPASAMTGATPSSSTQASAVSGATADRPDDLDENKPPKSRAPGQTDTSPGADAAPKPDKQNPGRGNSSAAKLCKKGGWAELARAEDPTTPFRNQGSCIHYVVRGGDVVGVTP